MHRQESDREDLLADATALVERIELSIPAFAEPVFVGFRKTGAVSVYFGQSECYQFNSAGELRRAFAAGRLYKAENRQLIAIDRERSPNETTLIQSDLTAAETSDLTATIERKLKQLLSALINNQVTIIGQVPAETNVAARVITWLKHLPLPPVIATRPHAQ